MTYPTVTETPRRLVPVEHDPFLDGPPSRLMARDVSPSPESTSPFASDAEPAGPRSQG